VKQEPPKYVAEALPARPLSLVNLILSNAICPIHVQSWYEYVRVHG